MGHFVEALMSDWPDHPWHYSPRVDLVNINTFPTGSTDEEDKKRDRTSHRRYNT